MPRKFPLPGPREIVHHVEQLRLTTREKLVVAITGAFGVVIGLSWNDTVKLLVERLLGMIGIPDGQNLGPKFVGSLFTTLIGVSVIVIVSRWAKKEAVLPLPSANMRSLKEYETPVSPKR
jgi:hypothetical protein